MKLSLVDVLSKAVGPFAVEEAMEDHNVEFVDLLDVSAKAVVRVVPKV